jgi:hypothetical protein
MRRILTWLRRLLRLEPSLEEPVLVPRRPLAPLLSGSVALELPDDPDDVDARGRESG